jgi:uncharacterized membrane protein YbhN (UPF0104 family)
VITAALLGIVLTKIPAAQVVPALLRAHPGYVTLGLLFMLLVVVLEAFRFSLLPARHGIAMPVREVLAINLASKFYGLFVPGYI